MENVGQDQGVEERNALRLEIIEYVYYYSSILLLTQDNGLEYKCKVKKYSCTVDLWRSFKWEMWTVVK